MSGSVDDDAVRAQLRVGSVLCGKYRLERVIGIGGMASVYAASHRNGRSFALKLLHPELSVRAEFRKRFLREAQAANAVKHPGVVVVLDDDVAEDGSAFLVMELLEGKSVEELWEENGRHLSTATVLVIASALCDVLAVAHDAGVIHRDLKPANLFMTQDAQLKILDFGIARARDEVGPRATQTGTVMGTPAFMAPEQAAGLTSEVDHHADIWAVGATMFTLLSGRSVHEGQSAQHIAVLAATKPAPSLAMTMPSAPANVVHIVDRALAFERTSRWSSAAEMRLAIREAIAALPEIGTPGGGALSETMLAVAGVQPLSARSAASESPRRAILGATTGQPVSSSAATAVAEPPPPRDASWWERTLAAGHRWRATHDAGDGVSSEAPTRRRLTSRSTTLALLVPLVAIAIVSLSVLAFRDRQIDEPRAPASGESVLGQPPLSAPTILPEVQTATEPKTPPVTSIAPPVLHSSPVSTRPSKGAVPHGRAPSSSSNAVPARLNCNPPFTIEDGIQIHKPGCP